MRIDLVYYLNKNKITLVRFCEINSLNSYASLCEYCEGKSLIPIDKDVYNREIPVKNMAKKKIETKVDETKNKKTSPPRRSRKASKVTKKRSSSAKDNSWRLL